MTTRAAASMQTDNASEHEGSESFEEHIAQCPRCSTGYLCDQASQLISKVMQEEES